MTDLQREANNRAYYDDFSDGYERERGIGYHRMLDDLEMQVVEPLARGKRVLEVGCGTGLILGRLARHAERACGMDISPGMLRAARARGLDVVVGSATCLPYADASFDLVCSFKVLAHVPDIALALSRNRARDPTGRNDGARVLQSVELALRGQASRRSAADQRRSHRSRCVHTLGFSARDTQTVTGGCRARGVSWCARADTRCIRAQVAARRSRVCRSRSNTSIDSPLRYFGGFLIAIARKRERRAAD